MRSGHANRTRLVPLAGREDVLEQPAHDRPARTRGLVPVGLGGELLVPVEVPRLHERHGAACDPDLNPIVVMREVGRRRARVRGANDELGVAAPRFARNRMDYEPGLERLAGQESPHRRVAHEVAVLRHAFDEKDPSPEVRDGPSPRTRQESQPIGDRQKLEARVTAVRGEGRAPRPRPRLEDVDSPGLGGKHLPEIEVESVVLGELVDPSIRQDATGEGRPVPRAAVSAKDHEQPERKRKFTSHLFGPVAHDLASELRPPSERQNESLAGRTGERLPLFRLPRRGKRDGDRNAESLADRGEPRAEILRQFGRRPEVEMNAFHPTPAPGVLEDRGERARPLRAHSLPAAGEACRRALLPENGQHERPLERRGRRRQGLDRAAAGERRGGHVEAYYLHRPEFGVNVVRHERRGFREEEGVAAREGRRLVRPRLCPGLPARGRREEERGDEDSGEGPDNRTARGERAAPARSRVSHGDDDNAGSVKPTTSPRPARGCANTLPAWCSAARRTAARPIPEPRDFVENVGSKSLPATSSGTPGPSSAHAKRTADAPPARVAFPAESRTWPGAAPIASTAFTRKFVRASRTRKGSAANGCRSGSVSVSIASVSCVRKSAATSSRSRATAARSSTRRSTAAGSPNRPSRPIRSVRIPTCRRIPAATSPIASGGGVSRFASKRRRRSAASRIGVSGFLMSCAIERAASTHAASLSARRKSVRSSRSRITRGARSSPGSVTIATRKKRSPRAPGMVTRIS